MDAEAARRLLDAEALSFARVEPVAEQGWASWTFELDGRFIVRFPRDDDIVGAMHREMRLLPALANWLPYRVPVPLHVTDDWFVYEKIVGGSVDWTQKQSWILGEALKRLHAFPVDEAAALLGVDARTAWHHQFTAQWSSFEEHALPLLSISLADRVREEYHANIGGFPTWEPCLVHNDLGLEHVLWEADGRLAGIIDFEDATIGDPAIDLVPAVAHLDHAALPGPRTDLLAGRDLGPDLGRRLWFYRWVGSLHAVSYYAQEGTDDDARLAARELRRRLDSPVAQ